MITRDEELKWAYLLDPCFELTNSAGKPLTDGYIEVYIAGTRNKYYCASDFAGTLHPFQIPLDSLGSNIVLANPDNAYDVYVYNRYGNLIMSRYNVTPADGGAVISNTERINELEDTLVSAVTGLQGQIDDINDALENKKDKQEPYSVTLTPTQTVSAIIQNENGEMEVIYQEIDLPEEVPNVDIVSPASTISITTHIDEETNTKTFSIDLSDLGHLEYGQYMATEDVITGANMYRIKGNLDTTLDGKIKLHKGNSYHITVRGAYVCTDITNSLNTLDYIEYSTFTPFHVDVDNTVTDPQNFEISYDIFKLSNDTNYYIAFAASAGKVSNLTVEIHSLSNLSILDPDFKYQEGWGINIVSSVISVDPDIFNDYTTHTDVYESIVTAIDFVTGAMPATQVQSDWDETDESSPAYIQNKPDLDIYATHDEVATAVSSIDLSNYTTHTEVYDSSVTAIQMATGVIPDSEEVQFEEINLNDYALASAIPDVSDFTTHEDVHESIVTAIEYVTGIIPEAQVQSDWDQSDDTQPDYIKNKPDLDIYATHDEVTDAVTSIDLSEYATHTEVYDSSVTAIQLVTGLIPDVSDFTTHDDVYESIVTAIDFVTGAMPAGQVQSDWTETDTSDPAYIKNKPNEYGLVAGDNIGIIIDNIDREIVISASATDLSGCATKEELQDGIEVVTGMIPDVSDFTTNNDVHESIVTAIEYVTGIIPDAQVQSNWTETDTADPSYIQNKPNEYNVVAGQNIGISINGDDFIISASGTDLSDYTTFEDVISIVSGVTGLTEYGQFYATNISGAATMSRTKGTIDVTNDGKIKLKKGSSYHVTVRGRYNQTTAANTYGDISYIEYITGQSIHVNVDKTITEAQYFELSYDLYKLNNDSNYYIFFSMSGGTVNDLFIEIHSLDGIGGSGTGPVTGGTEYDAGWGIQILNNVISVNPAIIPDISPLASKSELQDGLELVTGLIPTDYTTHNDVYEATVSAINVATGLIPDVSNLATKDELQDDIELVTGLIPDTSDLATKAELQDGLELVTGLIPPAQIQSDWEQSDNTQVDYIKNKPDLSVYATNTELESVSANIVNEIPDVSEFATRSEVNNVSGAIMNEMPDISNLATKEELQDDLELVTGLIPDAQIQSDWAQTDNTQVDYIKNKPTEYTVVAGQNIGITIDGNDFVISASATDLSGYVTTEQLQDSVELVTGLIPSLDGYATQTWVQNQGYLTSVPSEYVTESELNGAISGFATKYELNAIESEVQTISAAIPELPDEEEVEFEEINLSDYALASAIPDISDLATKSELDAVETEVQAVSAAIPELPDEEEVEFEEIDLSDYALVSAIPDVSNLATKSELQDGLELVTGLIPTVQLNGEDEVISINNYPIHSEGGATEYTAGDHIGIVNDEISVTGITELVAGNAITITTSGVSAIISSTGEAQVQSDWNVTDSSSKAYIKNKPTIPAAQVQSNWNETNTSSKAYIQNKPTIHNYTGASGVVINNDTITLDNPIGLVAGDNITIEVSGVSAIISAQGGGGSGDSDVFIATYGTTTFGEIYQAYLDNKVIYCKGTYGYNEDTGILHYYQGYGGNSTFEGVILNGTYETNVRITAGSRPSSISDSSANWSGTTTTLALSSQIPATLSAGNGITITNNTTVCINRLDVNPVINIFWI